MKIKNVLLLIECVTIDFEHTYILRSGVVQVVFITEYKSWQISNQIFFNVTLSFSKTKDKLVMTQLLQNTTIQWCHFAWGV